MEETYTDSLLSKYIASKVQISFIISDMCKEALFINLNHLALSFSQSVVQASICIMSETLFSKKLCYKNTVFD